MISNYGILIIRNEEGGEHMPFEIVRNDITRMQVDAIVTVSYTHLTLPTMAVV